MKVLKVVRYLCAVLILVVGIVFMLKVNGVVFNSIDTEVANELALMQMQNTEESSAMYESYRNLRNEANVIPLTLGAAVVTSLGVLLCFYPEIKHRFKEED